MVLDGKRLFLFDLEGVLCTHIDRPEVYPRALDLLAALRRTGREFVILTNISRKSKRSVLERLRAVGFDLGGGDLLTAGEAAALYIKAKGARRVFAITEGGLLEDLLTAGVEVVTEAPVDVVAVGASRDATYNDLNFAMRMVMAGSELVCAGASAHFRGSFHGDEGLFLGEAALAQAIAFGAGAEVTYVGKPYPEIFRRALELKNAEIAEAVMVGDTPRSDIKGARELGITSVLVTQGRALELGEERPDLVVRDVGELYKKLF